MSLNELLRDSNSNKWSNLNVQSITAPVSTITTLNATTINSIQENTLREVIKAVDNSDHVIDMSKDLGTARIASKIASTGVLQPYEIQASNVLWRNKFPIDEDETVLMGTQLITVGTPLGTVYGGRHKCIFANISPAGVVQAQSGGITLVSHALTSGVYDITCNDFTNILYCVATIADDQPYIISATPLSNAVVRVHTRVAVGGNVDATFVVAIFGDAI